METKANLEQDHDALTKGAMSYLIELQIAAGPLTYVVAQANTRDNARALIDAELGRDDANDDVVIVGVHAIH